MLSLVDISSYWTYFGARRILVATPMIAAETSRLAIASPATRESIFARLAALLTRAAAVAAERQISDDEAVWTSVARGF